MSYWTEVHQIYVRCWVIIAAINAPINTAKHAKWFQFLCWNLSVLPMKYQTRHQGNLF